MHVTRAASMAEQSHRCRVVLNPTARHLNAPWIQGTPARWPVPEKKSTQSTRPAARYDLQHVGVPRRRRGRAAARPAHSASRITPP